MKNQRDLSSSATVGKCNCSGATESRFELQIRNDLWQDSEEVCFAKLFRMATLKRGLELRHLDETLPSCETTLTSSKCSLRNMRADKSKPTTLNRILTLLDLFFRKQNQ